MTNHQDPSRSESEEEDYFSANEHEGSQAGSDVEMRDRDMDWELEDALNASVSISCTLGGNAYTARVLLCANAAIIMAELQSASDMKQLLSTNTLQRILMVDPHSEEVDTGEVLDLPLFSSKFTYDASKLPNAAEALYDLILTLHESEVMLVTDGTHCIAVSTVEIPGRRGDNAVIVFTPPLSSSKSNEAALHRFPTIEDTCTCVNKIFQSPLELISYNMRPKPSSNNGYDAILPIYESNLRLLERTMKLSDMGSDIQADQRRITDMTRGLTAEENKTMDAIASAAAFQRQVAELEEQLKQVQEVTNTLLFEQSQQAQEVHWQEWDRDYAASPGRSTPDNKTKPKAREVLGKVYHAATRYLSTSTTPSKATPNRPSGSTSTFASGSTRSQHADIVEGREEAVRLQAQFSMEDEAIYRSAASSKTNAPKALLKPLSRSNSYSPPFGTSSGSSGHHDNDPGFEEAMRLQAQFTAEEEASWQLARQLEEEERAQIAVYEELQRVEKENAPFDCPICADTHPRGNLVKVEACGQECAICRECLLQHVKAQVEQARWPIFCPVCPIDSPNRGVVSRWMAEIVGADDAVFEQWNRMELAGFSISVECPRCKVSTPLDAEDFREATELECPQGCGCYWCKNCHHEIARGAIHSCDGEAEFRELVRQQSNTFRPCPQCGTMIEKNGGCDRMVCTAPGCRTNFSWAAAKHP